MKSIAVGFGFDVHRFTEKKKQMILAGICINCGFGIKAVSDGDVVLHAISDAILGAASLGDIGDYFPPRDPALKGIKSTLIVKEVLKKIRNRFKVNNIDTVIVAQKPRLSPYKKKMLASLKRIFGTKDINVKIKSKEKLNILGGVNCISCFSVATLKKC